MCCAKSEEFSLKANFCNLASIVIRDLLQMGLVEEGGPGERQRNDTHYDHNHHDHQVHQDQDQDQDGLREREKRVERLQRCLERTTMRPMQRKMMTPVIMMMVMKMRAVVVLDSRF